MKKLFKVLFAIPLFLVISNSQVFAGPPSIEMSIYPRTTSGEIQWVLDFVKENKGKITLKKLVYENDVLKEISGSLEFTDGVKTEFLANGDFKRLYIKRTLVTITKYMLK